MRKNASFKIVNIIAPRSGLLDLGLDSNDYISSHLSMNIKQINYKYIVIMKKSTFFNIVKFLVLIGSGALVLGQGLKYYILRTELLHHHL